MRRNPRVPRAATCLTLVALMAAPAPGQDAPVEITGLTLAEEGGAVVLEVGAARPLEWSSAFTTGGTLVVTFPGSVPGPAVGSISRDSGLVAAVEVGFAVPGGEPTTTVSVLGRGALRYEQLPAEAGLRLALRTPGESPAAPPASEALRRQLESEAGRARQLAAELEQARTELERARTELRRESERAERLEADRLGLLSEVEEVRGQAAALRAELDERQSGERRQEQEVEAAAAAARDEREGALARARAAEERAASLASEVERLEAARAAAADRAATAGGELAAARREQESLRDELARAREQLAAAAEDGDALRRQAAARAGSAEERAETARQLLGQAPRLLGADEFVVADGIAPCLNLRAGPSRDGQVVDCLPPGSPFTVVTLADGWLRARLADGREGWVASEFVEPLMRRELARERQQREQLADSLERLRRERDQATARVAELEGVEARLRAAEESLALAATEARGWTERLAAAEGRVEAVLAALGAERVRVGAEVAPCLRLRPEPRADGASLDCLEPGTEARVVDFRPGWAALRLDDERRGWAAVDYLEPAVGAELRAAADRAAGLSAERRDLERRLAEAQAAGAALAGELEEASSRLDERDGEVAELTAVAARLRDEASALSEEAASARAAAAESDERRRAAERRVAAVEAAGAAGAGELEEALSRLRQRDGEAAELTALVARLREETSALEQELATARAAAVESGEQRRAAEERLAAAEAARDELAALDAGGQLRAELETARAEAEAARAELRAAREEAASRGAAAAAVGEELASARAQGEELRRQLAAAEQAQRQAEVELEDLRAAAAAAPPPVDETALRQALARVAALERHRDQLDLELADMAAEREELRARLETAAAAGERVAAGVEGSAEEPAAGGLVPAEPVRPEPIPAKPIPAEPVAAEPVAAEPDPVRPAPAEPLGPQPAELPSAADLVALVEAWAAAWSEQRVEDYLFFYASDFVSADGTDRAAWEAQRRARLTRPSFIEVEVDDFVVEVEGPERARVVFEQAYRSNTYQDRVRKSLELVREAGLWKILGEVAF